MRVVLGPVSGGLRQSGLQNPHLMVWTSYAAVKVSCGREGFVKASCCSMGEGMTPSLRWVAIIVASFLIGCGKPPNSPYPAAQSSDSVLYASFEARPKHLDPARAYSANELEIISQVYEPLLQYAYLKRPYELEPLSAIEFPTVAYLDRMGNRLPDSASEDSIAISVYDIELRGDLVYQPHPAFAKDPMGRYLYHSIGSGEISGIHRLSDFRSTGFRAVSAADFAYQIKRLVHPKVHSPIAEMMSEHIIGLRELGQRLAQDFGQHPPDGGWLDLRAYGLEGVEVVNDHHLRIRLYGKYPQFRFWLAMPFFAPMPWEAEAFFSQPELVKKNITLDWYPVGSGPYCLIENNPNRRMVLKRNPNYHFSSYPDVGEAQDKRTGLLTSAGQRLPFIDSIVFVLEKETIPYWNKFLQGYYDSSGLASDNFDQAIQFSGIGNAEPTPEMTGRGIELTTDVTASILYVGFNMLDSVVGGLDEAHAKLRRAISIAIDEEEFISIFMNGRGIAAQGLVPPGIFGFAEGADGINPYVYRWQDGGARRKSIAEAQKLLEEAGYPGGKDPATGNALVLYMDTTSSGVDDRPALNWYRKQLVKVGIQLVLRTTDYNQFQQKMATGNAQLFRWGWNADYPDPENFFFLMLSQNAKVGKGGENASNYANPKFDALFNLMRNMPDGPARFSVIQRMQEILRHDAPWVFGVHPKSYSLHHAWYKNYKPNQMANNTFKYLQIDAVQRMHRRMEWNRPVYWPLWLLGFLLFLALIPGWLVYRRAMRSGGL